MIDSIYERISGMPVMYVIFALSLCGLILVSILAFEAFEWRHKLLAKHRSEEPGVADLLNWSSIIEDGIVLNKNGSLMAGWIYRGQDNASLTNVERNHIAKMINAAINQLGSGWMFHIDGIRWACPSYSPREFSHFPDPVSQAIDDERRAFFEKVGTLYEGCYVLVATYFPPALTQAKFVELLFDDPDAKSVDAMQRGQRIVEQFRRDINALHGRLSTVLSMERLGGVKRIAEDGSEYVEDDFLRWLHYTLTGINQPVLLPNNPAFIDCLVGGQEMVGGTVPIIGEKFIKVIGIDNFPFESSPGILSLLSELPVDYRWSTRFIFLDQHEAVALVDKFRRKWRQKVRGLADQILNRNGQINQDAALMVQDCDQALLEVNSGAVAMGQFTSNIILMDEDKEKVEKAAQYIQKMLGSVGFPARIEDVNCMDAFFGTLPGHGVENVRRCLMNTMHVAHFVPTNSIYSGEEMAPCDLYPAFSPSLMHCVTNGRTPCRVNLHVQSLGHTIVFGPTGAGKSVLINTLESQFLRYQNMRVFVIDKGMSAYTLCKSVGGQHYNIGGDDYIDAEGNRHTENAFCPLQYLESRQDRAWACSWIETMAVLNGVAVSPEQRNEIASRMEVFVESRHRTLLSFVNGLQDRALKESLEVYTRKGMMGYMLDADEDELNLKDKGGMVVFEVEELMGMGEPRFVLPVLLYLFRRIERALNGQPAAIFMDEAWLMLGHETFRNKIREWLKVLRKANCALIMATQSLSDAVGSGILDVIRESTATRIFLPNPHARGEDTAEVYRRMGLNSRQIDIISAAVQKRHYYLSSEKGNRLFELALGPLEMAILAVSDKDSVALVKKLEHEQGPDWLYTWLRMKQVDEAIIARIRGERAEWLRGA